MAGRPRRPARQVNHFRPTFLVNMHSQGTFMELENSSYFMLLLLNLPLKVFPSAVVSPDDSSLSTTNRKVRFFLNPGLRVVKLSCRSSMAVQGFHGTKGSNFTRRAALGLLWSVRLLRSPFPENPTSTSGLPAAGRTEPSKFKTDGGSGTHTFF